MRGKASKEVLEATDKPFEVEYKGLKFGLVGFNLVPKHPASEEVVCAWKAKHDEKVVLYWASKKEKKTPRWNRFLKKWKEAVPDYEFQNIDDMLKNMHEQQHVFSRL